MNLDSQKELTPVLYGSGAVRLLKFDFPRSHICFDMHWHERMELLLITDGILTVNFGNTVFNAKAGEMVIIPPTQPHEGIAAANVSYHVLMFDIELFYNNIPAVCEYFKKICDRRIVFKNKTSCREVIDTAYRLIKDYYDGGSTVAVSTAAKVYELTALMYKYCISEDKAVSPNEGSFKKVLEFVNENYLSDITSSSLSRKFGFDSAYFSRRFKAVTGLNPTVYIRILRLEKAQKMLRQGFSVANTAQACGFSDSVYFTRCFKKHFGITPTQFLR